MEKLYNYVFHYNHYNELWYAIPRELYNQYWTTPDTDDILKSKHFNALLDVIINQK